MVRDESFLDFAQEIISGINQGLRDNEMDIVFYYDTR